MNTPVSKKELLHNFFTRLPFTAGILRYLFGQLNKNSLVILNYHQIAVAHEHVPDWCCLSQNRFSAQMEYLAKHFEVVALAEGINSVNKKRTTAKPMVAVTFDDGFRNNYDHAFPILKKLKIPATIFLATGFVDGEDTLWSCKLNQALGESKLTRLLWNTNQYSLASLLEKTRTFRRLQVDLKKLPHDKLLKECRRIITLLGGDFDQPVDRSSLYRMLDCRAIGDMLQSGLIEFGAHTRDHVILSRVAQHEQRTQISEAVAYVKKITGGQNVIFAYPNGTKTDYDQRSLEELVRANIDHAVTTMPGVNNQRTNPLELKRIGVGGDWQLGLFKFAVHTGITA